MDRERWNRLSSVFITARDRPSGERSAFLAEVCGDDLSLLREVEGMLAADAVGSELRLERGVLGNLPAGTRVGAYLIHSLVAEGGMGEVYRAERVDGSYRQTVAIKVLRPGYRTAEAVRRFRLERQVLARLEHPDIAAILDGGTTRDGRPYLVLQFVDGVPITDFCRGRPIDERLRLLSRVARVVQFAHGRLIVHRDLKPSNILVQPDGSPRLLDFGIAKLLDPGADEGLQPATRPETRLLTPEHAAPEQLRGEPVSTATDVYALGVLLYSLLCGRRPFPTRGRQLSELEASILEDNPAPPSAMLTDPAERRTVTRDLDRIALMALRKEPDRRYASAGDFAEDLDRYLAGKPVSAERDTWAYRAGKFISRNRLWVTLAGMSAVILLLALASTIWQGRQAARERDRAEQERAAAEDVLTMLTDLFRSANPKVVPGGDTVRVTALLDEAERRVEELKAHPDRQARLLRVLGNVRLARGQYPRGITLLRRAWQWQHDSQPAVNADGALTYFELTQAENAFRGSVARPMIDTAIALLYRVGNLDSVVAKALIFQAFSEPSEAKRRALLDSSIAVQRRVPGKDSMAIAEQLDAQGGQLFAKGRSREAAASFGAALRIVERLLPETHPDRLTVMGNFATALHAAGELQQADSLARQILATVHRLYPGTDGEAFAHSRLANILASEGRHADAETEFRATLDILERTLAPDHDRIFNELRNLGIIIAREGRVEEGLKLVDSAYRLGLAKQGPTGVGSAYILGQRGYLLLWLGRTAEAATALHEAERVVLAGTSEGHRYRIDVAFWLGLLAMAQGDNGAAVSYMSAALEIPSEEASDTAPRRAQIGCGLGTALARAGREREAVPLLRETCPVFDRYAAEQPPLARWSREARTRLGLP
jgi:serine/threonine-protein kinase